MNHISIAFYAPSLIVPVNYNQEVQRLLYQLAAGGSGKQWYNADKSDQRYKLFTFSSLRGEKRVINGLIFFERMIYLDVRSIHNKFCDMLYNALCSNELPVLFGQRMVVQMIKKYIPDIASDSLFIKMLSPITVQNISETGKIHYCSPFDLEFSSQVNNIFTHKYKSYAGNFPSDDVTIIPVVVGERERQTTLIRNMKITAWRGAYRLFGNPKHLEFLYYCGLGSRTSDGFGMFEVIKDSPTDH